VRVRRERLAGFEAAISLDGKSELTADRGEFGEADVSRLRRALAQVTQTESTNYYPRI
jgi:hypothetical protein